jgi:heat shock protein HslJ
MSRSPFPLIGLSAGAILTLGLLLAFAGLPGNSSSLGGGKAAPAAQATTLTGTMWEWEVTEINDGTVITATDPSRYTVEFLDSGQMGIRADCNRGSGTYTMNGSQLQITPGAFTKIGCPPDTQDQVFLRDLAKVSGYVFIQGNLILQLPFDSGSMTFREAQLTTQATPTPAGQTTPAPAATPGIESGLTDGLWQWQRTDMNDGTTNTVPNPAQYTLELLPDGTGGIRADCNIGNLEYMLSGANGIDITLGVSTLVACPPGSLDTLYRQQLEAASAYQVQGDTLVLGLPDGSSMIFGRTARVEPPTPAPAQPPQVGPTAVPPASPEVPGMPRTGAKD